jgi:parallel beta helix pectate lyase-like protein
VQLKPLIVLAAIVGLAVLPTTAPAAPGRNLWVSSAPISAADSGCATPGYNTIQSAINAAPAGATIRVCTGIYVEALTITQPVSLVAAGPVTVEVPAIPANSTTACDSAPGTAAYQPDQDAIAICTGGTVNIAGLTIDAAWPANTCDDSLYGVLVAGGATLNLANSSVVAAGAVPLNGCQGGVGIQVGMAWTTPVEVGHANLSGVKISDYQKNGVTVDGVGSSADIGSTTVTGSGPTPAIAQNGIQVSNGASGMIRNSTISGNECDVAVCGPDILNDTQSIGVLFFGAAAGSSVTGSTISANDVGVYNDEQIPPTAPAISVLGDTLVANRYAGVLLDEGWTSVSGDNITGGDVGIGVLQYNGQHFAADGTAFLDVIRNASIAAVQVESDRAGLGDHPGALTLSFSQLRGNAARVLDNSSNYVVSQRSNF